jgi:hypothetical protein
MAAILARRETRERLRVHSGKSLDYLNRQAAKLRERTDVIVQQGKSLIECKGSDSVAHANDADKQEYQEERREHLGG